MTDSRPTGSFLNPSLSSEYTPTRTSARSRARSISSDANRLPQHLVHKDDELPERELATPDFTLDRPSGSGPSGLRNLVALQREDSVQLSRSQSDTGTSLPPTRRPRLTHQIRSFFTSISGEAYNRHGDSDDTTSSTQKARTSGEYGKIGGPSSAGRFQGLTASAQSLTNEQHGSSRSQWPKPLLMPSARQGAPMGLVGFNDESPPLTPSEGDERDSEADYYHSKQNRAVQISRGTIADRGTTPASATTTTVSSLNSGRDSPSFSTLSASTASGTVSPPTRPTSRTSEAHKYVATDGLLPSHHFSPPASPKLNTDTRTSSRQVLVASSWTEVVPTLVSSLSERFSSLSSEVRLPPLRPHLPAMLFFMTAFIGSTLCVVLALSTLPLHLPNHISDLTLTEIRDMSLSLRQYSRSSPKAFAHTLSVLGFFFTWKQSFTIPGSLIMNVVFGAMYGTWMGTLYTSILTSIGGVFCYLLIAPLGPLISGMPGLRKGLQKIRKALHLQTPLSPTSRRNGQAHKQGSNLWSYLLVLRLLPVVPYGLMNIACSILRIPLLPYAVTIAVGSIPWNACTVQIGDLLVEVASAFPSENVNGVDLGGQIDANGFIDAPSPSSAFKVHMANGAATAIKGKTQSGLHAITEKVWNRNMMIKLALMSLVSLAPLLIQRWLKRRQAVQDDDVVNEEAEDSVGDVDAVEKGDCEEASSQTDHISMRNWRSSWQGTNSLSENHHTPTPWRHNNSGSISHDEARLPTTKRAVASAVV